MLSESDITIAKTSKKLNIKFVKNYFFNVFFVMHLISVLIKILPTDQRQSGI